MNSILIKPHHFIDIIKLYGSGIDRFVPDEKMGHDFYKVANEIIENPSIDQDYLNFMNYIRSSFLFFIIIENTSMTGVK